MTKLTSFTDKLSALMPFSLPCSPTTIAQRVLELPNDLILSPPIPVGIFLQEAYNIFRFIQDDKGLFLAKNCNWGIVDELPARIDFLRDAEAAWMSIRYRRGLSIFLNRIRYGNAGKCDGDHKLFFYRIFLG